MIRPMPFWPSFEPCEKLTPVQVRTSSPRIQNGGGSVPAGASYRRLSLITALERSRSIAATPKPISGEINRLWPNIPAARFQEVDTAFGQWKMAIYELLLYIRDNEIHHRGQGYVYLRSLGIEPPPFWERG